MGSFALMAEGGLPTVSPMSYWSLLSRMISIYTTSVVTEHV